MKEEGEEEEFFFKRGRKHSPPFLFLSSFAAHSFLLFSKQIKHYY